MAAPSIDSAMEAAAHARASEHSCLLLGVSSDVAAHGWKLASAADSTLSNLPIGLPLWAVKIGPRGCVANKEKIMNDCTRRAFLGFAQGAAATTAIGALGAGFIEVADALPVQISPIQTTPPAVRSRTA